MTPPELGEFSGQMAKQHGVAAVALGCGEAEEEEQLQAPPDCCSWVPTDRVLHPPMLPCGEALASGGIHSGEARLPQLGMESQADDSSQCNASLQIKSYFTQVTSREGLRPSCPEG